VSNLLVGGCTRACDAPRAGGGHGEREVHRGWVPGLAAAAASAVRARLVGLVSSGVRRHGGANHPSHASLSSRLQQRPPQPMTFDMSQPISDEVFQAERWAGSGKSARGHAHQVTAAGVMQHCTDAAQQPPT
jgi:hypothetical protein